MAEHINLETGLGKLSLYTFAFPDQVKRLSLDPQFSEHRGLGSLETIREALMRRAAEKDANVVLAVTNEEKIVGFSLHAPPQPDQRWAAINSDAVMELEAVGVTRDWRRMGVGRALVEAALCCPKAEERIVYAVGYHWTWDLEGAKLNAAQYRTMIIRLLQPFGFAERRTNEPNVCLDAHNLFISRIGNQVNGRLQVDFKWLSLIGNFRT